MRYRPAIPVLVWAALGGLGLSGQANTEIKFDVASVKPSTPRPGRPVWPRIMGGPGTRDPERFTAENFSLYYLLSTAYDVKRYQLVVPVWTETTFFDVTAKVPPGASKAQFRSMLQNLLVDRFHLVSHWEDKVITAYDLIVGSGGAKGKLADTVSSPGTPYFDGLAQGSGGDTVRPPTPQVTIINGDQHLQVTNETMEQFASWVSGEIRQPVSNLTSLTGIYAIGLTWRRDARGQGQDTPTPAVSQSDTLSGADAAPSIFVAIQQQLGLKLAPRKGTVKALVVDTIARFPTPN